MERVWQAARDAGSGIAGKLRLAYTLSADHDTVPRLVEALHHAHRGVAVTTDLLPGPQVLLAVRDGGADVGIAWATTGIVERDIAFDLSHGAITGSTALALVGRSTALRLPPDLRWIPLSEPVAITMALVFSTREQAVAAKNFERSPTATPAHTAGFSRTDQPNLPHSVDQNRS